MEKLYIEIEMDNDAFVQNFRYEIRTIMENIYEKVAGWDLDGDPNVFWIRDSNGNPVGHVKYERTRQ